MGTAPFKFDPFSTSPKDWCMENEGGMLIGESPSWPTRSVKYGPFISVQNQFYLANKNGWMGVMPWSDTDVDHGSKPENIYKGLQCRFDWENCNVTVNQLMY